MAKKSRRERKAEAQVAPAAPRVPTSTAVMPAAGASTQTLTAPSAVAARPPTAPPPSRAGRATAATAEAPARIPRKEMIEEWLYVRKDLRHIMILAIILFGGLIAAALILPRMLGY